jgi:hypothetical protein
MAGRLECGLDRKFGLRRPWDKAGDRDEPLPTLRVGAAEFSGCRADRTITSLGAWLPRIGVLAAR